MAAVLALGAHLKNAACLRRGASPASGRVTWSAMHGDLATPQACAALERSAEELLALAGGRVDAVAHDLHPDFHSTRLAHALAARLGVPAVGVQHHHAHIGVLMAERGLDEPVIGLALDGVGFGADGTAWGGELLLVDGATYERVGHLQPLPLPGGDVAAREPWRVAAAVLHDLGRGDEIEARFGSSIGVPLARGVAQMLERGVHSPVTTSTGRWFDAAAAALGLCLRQSHEAEAAMALEHLATQWLAAHALPVCADLVVVRDGVVDLRPLLVQLFELGARGEAGQGAALFHAVLAEGLAQAASRAASDVGALTVALGGGCFFNRLLTARIRARLHRFALDVVMPETVDCGDAGLALGQAWVAAKQLQRQAAIDVPAWPGPRDPRAAAATSSVASSPEVRPCA